MKKLLLIALLVCLKQINAQCDLTITGYTNTCAGNTTTLTVSGATSYTWMPSGMNTASIVIAPNVTTIYTVTGATGTCTTSNTVEIVVDNYSPILTVNSVTICPGGPIYLTAYGAETYSWTTNSTDAVIYFQSNAVINNPTVSSSFTVTAIDSNGCWSLTKATSTVTVLSTPHIDTITAIIDTSVCGLNNGSISITNIDVSSGTQPYHYQWYSGSGIALHNDTLLILNPATSGSYSIQIIDSNGCVSNLNNTNATFVIPSTLPEVSVNFLLVEDTLVNTWSVYPTYGANVSNAVWYWGDGTQTVGLYPSHTFTAPITYTTICVSASDTNGCYGYYCQDMFNCITCNYSTASINVLQNNTMSIQYLTANSNQILIYPNPNYGNFIIETNSTDTQTLQIFDVTGKMVLNQIINGKTYIDSSNLDNGVYFIQVKTKEGISTQKIIVQH